MKIWNCFLNSYLNCWTILCAKFFPLHRIWILWLLHVWYSWAKWHQSTVPTPSILMCQITKQWISLHQLFLHKGRKLVNYFERCSPRPLHDLVTIRVFNFLYNVAQCGSHIRSWKMKVWYLVHSITTYNIFSIAPFRKKLKISTFFFAMPFDCNG